MEIVLEEADETLFWLEIIMDKNWLNKTVTETIWKEGNELTSIFVSSLKTVKAKSY
jgi:four helix bundle protein